MAAKKKRKPATLSKNEPPRFTEAQQRVIDHNEGPMLAGAVAGAGKTTTLVERTARLFNAKMPLDRICLLAFNVDAADQINRKLKKRLNIKGELEVARTLHSLAYAIWKTTADSARFSLDKNGGLLTKAIRQGAKSIGIDHYDMALVKKLSSKIKNDMLLSEADEARRLLGQTSPVLIQAANEVIATKRDSASKPQYLLALFFAAEQAREEGVDQGDGTHVRFVDYNDLLHLAARSLEDIPELFDMWTDKYDDITVDEAQDLCEAQWRIVHALARRRRNILVVGDPGQAVYGFRGARPEHFLNFPKKYQNTRCVYMQENFRSAGRIIEIGNVALNGIPAAERLPMQLIGTREELGFVGLRVSETARDEARDIAANVLKHHDKGVEWRDQAILVRTNDQTAVLELELMKKRVPVRVAAGASFFVSREAKTVLAYLRMITCRAQDDDFETAILNPPKYLGRAFVDQIKKGAPETLPEGFDWLALMEELPVVNDRRYAGNARDFMVKMRSWRLAYEKGATPYQLFDAICSSTDFVKWAVGGSESDPDNDGQLNFQSVKDFLLSFDSVKVLLDTVDELRAQQRAAAQSRNAVIISTVHRVKGLEWAVVYIAGLGEKRWPIPWSPLAEERRVFYVAVTRARDELWFSHHHFSDDDGTLDMKPSPYLAELGLEPTEQIGQQVLAAGQMTLM